MNRTSKRDDGTPRRESQRSVAELLARYGEAPSGSRRHRRRTAETEGGRSESGSVARHRPPPPGSRRGADPARAARLSPAPTEDSRLDPSLRDPALAPTPLPGAGRPRGGEPPASLAPRPGGSVIALTPGAETPGFVREPAAPAPGDPGFDDLRAVREPHRDEGHHQQVGYHGEEPEDELSSAREWAVVAGQVGLGVVGGAALWLVCEWLWQSIPVLALVVALLVITSLVWVVRYVRKTEDLQTTVIAVLVGLFVTVSPAALLLVGR